MSRIVERFRIMEHRTKTLGLSGTPSPCDETCCRQLWRWLSFVGEGGRGVSFGGVWLCVVVFRWCASCLTVTSFKARFFLVGVSLRILLASA